MGDKRFAAVICEFNPFHRGHEYLLSEIKKNFDGIICVMSGDLVQRGDCAVADKYLRARAALVCGADLVVELLPPWCCSSAADFARAGISVASRLGADAVAFGVEGEESDLIKIAGLMNDVSFDEKVRSLASDREKAVSYPAALTAAVSEELGEAVAEELRKPNNILAVEYLRRLSGGAPAPFMIKRDCGFPSSSAIRALGSAEAMLETLPLPARGVFAAEAGKGFPRDISRLDAYFVGFFRSLSDISSLDGVYGMTKDLAYKLALSAKTANGFYELCANCVDKKYTSARVRRAALAALLGFCAEDVKKDPPFTAVLAADEAGRAFLASSRRSRAIAVVTKPVRARLNGEEAKAAFDLSERASDIIALTAPAPSPVTAGRTPYII